MEAAYQSATTLFYRLKMVDKDGNYTYSPVVAISLGGLITSMDVFPNPVQSAEARINISAVVEETARWKLVNNNGQTVFSNSIQLHRGGNSMIINMYSLPSGTYYLQVSGIGINEKLKLQKL
jgi:hypothetical protein